MSWLVNISEKLTDVASQLTINQSSDSNELDNKELNLSNTLLKENEALMTEKALLEKSIEELDQQHEEYLQQMLKSKEEMVQQNLSLQQSILELKETIKSKPDEIEFEQLKKSKGEMIQENQFLQNTITELNERCSKHLSEADRSLLAKDNLLAEENKILQVTITNLRKKLEDSEEICKTNEIINQHNISLQETISQLENKLKSLDDSKSNVELFNQEADYINDNKSLQTKCSEGKESYNVMNTVESEKDLLLKNNILQQTNSELNEKIIYFENYINQLNKSKEETSQHNSNLEKTILELNENLKMYKEIKAPTGNNVGKTDSEKVLENKVEELLSSNNLIQQKYENLLYENKLASLSTGADKDMIDQQEINKNLLSKSIDENTILKNEIQDLNFKFTQLENSFIEAKNQYEVTLNNLNVENENKLLELNKNLLQRTSEVDKYQNENQRLESRISNLTNDYTLVLEKLSKSGLESKENISIITSINLLVLKLIDKFSIKRPDNQKSNLYLQFSENVNVLMEFIEHNFNDIDKLRHTEVERDNLRLLLQKTTTDLNVSNDKFDEASKQIFVLQQKLSCSRSDILTTTEQHKKIVADLKADFQTTKLNLNKAIEELTAKNIGLQVQIDSYDDNYVKKYQTLLTENASLLQEIESMKSSLSLVQNSQADSVTINVLDLDEIKKKADLSDKLLFDLNQKSEEYKYLEKQLEILTADSLETKHALEIIEKDNRRLKNHLVEMEELQTQECIEATSKEQALQNRIKLLESDLSQFTDSTRNEQLSKSKAFSQLDTELKRVQLDFDNCKKKCFQQEKLIDEYKMSTANLQLVLEEFQKDSNSIEFFELEKTKKILETERALKDQLVLKCFEIEEKMNSLKSIESKHHQLLDAFKTVEQEVLKLKQTIGVKEEFITTLEDRLSLIKIDKEAKIEKLVIKNLILGYFHAPTTKKSEVITVIGHILDFSKEDFDLLYSKDSMRWIDRILFSNEANNFKNQSFMEQFVKFLEKESTPPLHLSLTASFQQSQLGAINTDQSEHGKVDQGNVVLSKYLATLQQQKAIQTTQTEKQNTNTN